MALDAGQVLHGGIIIGRGGDDPISFRQLDAPLQEVVDVLRTRYSLAVRLDPDSYSISYYYGMGVASRVVRSDGHGAVLRLIDGSGSLHVNGWTVRMACGDWAYIPAGMSYHCVGTVVHSRTHNLRFATSRLLRG